MFKDLFQSKLATNQRGDSLHQFARNKAGSVALPLALLAASGVVGFMVLSPANIQERRITITALTKACDQASSDIVGTMASLHNHQNIYTPDWSNRLSAATQAARGGVAAVLAAEYNLSDGRNLPDDITLNAAQITGEKWRRFVEEDPVNGLGIEALDKTTGLVETVPLSEYAHVNHVNKKYTHYDKGLTSGATVLVPFRRDLVVDVYKITLTSRNEEVNRTLGVTSPDNLADDAPVTVNCFATDHYTIEFSGPRRGFEVLALFDQNTNLYPHNSIPKDTDRRPHKFCYTGSSVGGLRVLLYNTYLGLQRSPKVGSKSGAQIHSNPNSCGAIDSGDFTYTDFSALGTRRQMHKYREAGLFQPFMFYKGIPTDALDIPAYQHVGIMRKDGGVDSSEANIHNAFKHDDGTPIADGDRITDPTDSSKTVWSHAGWPGLINNDWLKRAATDSTSAPSLTIGDSNPFNDTHAKKLRNAFAAAFEPGLPGYIHCSGSTITYKVTAASLKAYMEAHGYVAWRTTDQYAKDLLLGSDPNFPISGRINTDPTVTGFQRLPYRDTYENASGGIERDLTATYEEITSRGGTDLQNNVNFIPIAEVGSKAIEEVKFGSKEGNKIDIFKRLYTGRVIGQVGGLPITMEQVDGAMPKWAFVSYYGGRASLAWNGGSWDIDSYDFHPGTFYKTQFGRTEWKVNNDDGTAITSNHWKDIQSHWRSTDGGTKDSIVGNGWGYRFHNDKGGLRWASYGFFDDPVVDRPGPDTTATPSHPLYLRDEANLDLGWRRNRSELDDEWASAWYGNCHNISALWTVSWRVCDVHLFSNPSGPAWVWLAMKDVAWWRTADHGLREGDGYGEAGPDGTENALGALPQVMIHPGHDGCVNTFRSHHVTTVLGTKTYRSTGIF